MKKFLLCLITLCTAFSLTSCQVNWFDRSYDVPWYFIAIPVVLILVISYVILITRTYVCPECGTEFKPRWYDFSVCLHINGERIVKCPNCGRKGFCNKKTDK